MHACVFLLLITLYNHVNFSRFITRNVAILYTL